MSRSRSRTPVSSRPKRKDPVVEAIEGVARIVGNLERKVTRYLKKQDEHNAIVLDRLRRLETVWRRADKSIGGLVEVIKITHDLVGQLREHAGGDIANLKREIARVESELDEKLERLKAAGRTEVVGR